MSARAGETVALHLPMRDGTLVAVDVSLPSSVPPGGVPTAIRATRYWRAAVGDPLREPVQRGQIEQLTARGLAVVSIDARGTGASTGVWRQAWSHDEIADTGEVIDWIADQPWSDGRVGAFGTSYDGTAALLATTTRRPALKAVVPRFCSVDIAHIVMPGGVPLEWFLRTWAAANCILDGHPERADPDVGPLPLAGEVRRVDADPDGSMLASARDERAGNYDVWSVARDATSREDFRGDDGLLTDEVSPAGRMEEIRASGVPIWAWTSWYDGGYSASALHLLAEPGLDVRVVIGPWAHGAGLPVLGSPFQPDAPMSPTGIEQLDAIADFLLAGMRGEVPAGPRLAYYTIGEEAWHTADEWPPAGVRTQRWYLGSGGALEPSPPATDASDVYEVDFEATTGATNRWHTLIGGPPVLYPDRAKQDERMLVYETPPLERDVEVTGSPVVVLHVRTTAPDGAFFAYLEDVAPDGTVTYVTEGMLRGLHRAVAPGPAPGVGGPRHTYSREHAEPMTPGERTELAFSMFPVSALFRAGHRIRVAIAGADADSFRRIPAEGDVTITVERGAEAASYVELPTRTS